MSSKVIAFSVLRMIQWWFNYWSDIHNYAVTFSFIQISINVGPSYHPKSI